MQAIKDYIRNLRHLPPTPHLVPELMRLLNQPDLDSSKIVNMISYDPPLTANVLRISNSAYFAAALPTTDLQEAVTRLGFQQVYQLLAASTGARLLKSAQEGLRLPIRSFGNIPSPPPSPRSSSPARWATTKTSSLSPPSSMTSAKPFSPIR